MFGYAFGRHHALSTGQVPSICFAMLPRLASGTTGQPSTAMIGVQSLCIDSVPLGHLMGMRGCWGSVWKEVPISRRWVYLCSARALGPSGMWHVSATSVVVRVEYMGVHIFAPHARVLRAQVRSVVRALQASVACIHIDRWRLFVNFFGPIVCVPVCYLRPSWVC